MSTDVLDIQNVTHRYDDRPALDDVSIRLADGGLLALLGPNGSGKTTLFRIISTLLSPLSGTISVCGRNVQQDPSGVRQCLGVVFQDVALDEGLTVQENLLHHAALHGMTGRSARSRADQMLNMLGLGDRSGARVKTLSGGLARRVDLARVLMHRPRLLLLDEPTTGLDPAARRDFWNALQLIRQSGSTSVLVATHLLEEADQCDSVCILSEGRVRATGAPDALKREIGSETLWIETSEPEDLADRIQTQFAVDARVLQGLVHVAHDQAHQLLGRMYEAFPGRIKSATVRRPTLEDVFLLHTGHTLAEYAEAPDNGAQPVQTP